MPFAQHDDDEGVGDDGDHQEVGHHIAVQRHGIPNRQFARHVDVVAAAWRQKFVDVCSVNAGLVEGAVGRFLGCGDGRVRGYLFGNWKTRYNHIVPGMRILEPAKK